MEELQISEIIRRIRNYDCFDAVSIDKSFYIKIREYVPFVCAAIHAGGNLRKSLKDKIIHSDYERWYEEDPSTDTFISSMPLTIVGKDSRFEYDLNRDSENCVYEDAWGKQVWKNPLGLTEKKISKLKHSNFYKVVDAIINSVEEIHNSCIVYDMHSYNYIRHKSHMPIFNIGTKNIDNKKYKKIVNKWKRELEKIIVRNTEVDCQINGPFMGNGYFLKHITSKFNHTLVLASEVKKIYCDELEQENFPLVIDDIEDGIKTAILETSSLFTEEIIGLKMKKGALLTPGIDNQLVEVDKKLYDLTKELEVLSYVTPTNLESERKKFFQNNEMINPDFKYKHIVEHPFEFKRELYNLNLEHIKDISIARLYRDVLESYSDKIDMLSTIGTKKFFFNSLRYFGQPNETDLKNAHFILNCPDERYDERMVDIEDVEQIFQKSIDEYGFNAKIEISKALTAEIQVLNYKRKVLLKKGTKISYESAKALVHHEIGVHMVTTMNAIEQPLNIFKLGFPTYTYTQEGIAVLTEYLSGYLTIKRLKELALRVVAVEMMVVGLDFKAVYHELVNTYYIPEDTAFTVTTRIFRGGGFTKDHLYLKGFIHLLHYYNEGNSIEPLLIGKNCIRYVELYKEMIARKLALPPKYITSILNNPKKCLASVDYVISGLKL